MSQLFDFLQADFISFLLRVLLLCGSVALIIWLTSFIAMAITKGRNYETIGFSTHILRTQMMGVVAALAAMAAYSIWLLHYNGLFTFYTWSWSCGWIAIIPELFIIVALFIRYFVLNQKIYKSLD